VNDRPEPPSYAIGACLNCRHVYLLTPTQRDCPLCMGPPRLWAPLAGVETPPYRAATPEPEEPAAPVVGFSEDLECPRCHRTITLNVIGEEFYLSLPEAEEEAGAAAEGTADQQPEAEAPAAPSHCPHQVLTEKWCQLCYEELTPEELEQIGRTVEAAEKRLAAVAAQPADVGTQEEAPADEAVERALEEAGENLAAAGPPAEEVERLPASDHDVP